MVNVWICVLGLVVAALLGGVVAYFVERHKAEARAAELNEAKNALTVAQSRLDEKNAEQERSIAEVENLRNEQTRLVAENAALTERNQNLVEAIENDRKEIENLQKRLTTEFENIANRIMKERAAEFSVSNEKQLGEVLNPLKDKITSFEKQVKEAYDKELRDKISLKEEVKKLTELNTRVSEEANNLAKALKGDVKKQGNWGEVILERLLETSGLKKGIEYEREVVVEGGEGETLRPDVIVYLPDNKHVIIDSKVSLVAYERLSNAKNDEEYQQFLKAHIESIKSHVKQLSEKNYQLAMGLNTPDFVLLFLPIEASFAAAVQAEQNLFSYAWDRKIVIVSPTTLLVTLRTIASIWKQENQTRNAQEIARLSGALYDKLVGIMADFTKVKENIDRAGSSYDDAMKKMKEGSGNLFSTANKIKKLGAKTAKELPENLIE
ncbi:MAG TPA: DNA recombination protein RmuC [Paludibacteraceae bacterium]|nr:DNA recombination protein RmuC [Paludibacteraceae bacterium]